MLVNGLLLIFKGLYIPRAETREEHDFLTGLGASHAACYSHRFRRAGRRRLGDFYEFDGGRPWRTTAAEEATNQGGYSEVRAAEKSPKAVRRRRGSNEKTGNSESVHGFEVSAPSRVGRAVRPSPARKWPRAPFARKTH